MVAIFAPAGAFAGSLLPRDIYLTSNRAGLVGEFLFGQDLIQSRENSAVVGAANATEVVAAGAVPPIYGDHRVELGNGTGLDTGVAMPAGAQTLMLVCNAQVTDGAAFSSSLIYSGRSAAANGALLIIADTNGGQNIRARMQDVTGTDVVLPNFPVRPLTAFRCFIASVAAAAKGSAVNIGEYYGGALVQQASGVLTVDRSAAACNIVTGNSSTLGANAGYNARAQHVSRLDYTRELSAAEKLSTYLDWRANLASMGIDC